MVPPFMGNHTELMTSLRIYKLKAVLVPLKCLNSIEGERCYHNLRNREMEGNTTVGHHRTTLFE
jgi:hypothetical protein